MIDEQRLTIDLDVVNPQVTQFGATDAGRVERLQNSPIAKTQWRVDIGLGQDAFHFVRRQDCFGKCFGLLRQIDLGSRVEGEVILLGQPGKEC